MPLPVSSMMRRDLSSFSDSTEAPEPCLRPSHWKYAVSSIRRKSTHLPPIMQTPTKWLSFSDSWGYLHDPGDAPHQHWSPCVWWSAGWSFEVLKFSLKTWVLRGGRMCVPSLPHVSRASTLGTQPLSAPSSVGKLPATMCSQSRKVNKSGVRDGRMILQELVHRGEKHVAENQVLRPCL